MTENFQLGVHEFQRLSGFLRDRFGLDYPLPKKAELEKSCARLAAGRPSAQFCADVTSGPDEKLLQRLVNELTVGETYFFRIQAHFDALQNVILPGLYRKRREEKCLRVWSAGCATGEEPYSVAMLILETLAEPESWNIDLLATDVNTDFIADAREGRYREWSFRKVGEYWRRKYFTPRGETWQVADRVRGMVRFATANLREERDNVVAAGPAPFDLILCRNVLIYFDDESIAQVSAFFRRYLAPGGWYVGGHVEPVVFQDGFEAVTFPGAIVYRRREVGEEVPAKKRRPPRERKPAPRRARRPADKLAQADRLVAGGQDQQALEELEGIVSARDDAEACWRMGRVLGNLGRYEEALDWCRRGKELDQTDPHGYYIAALVQEEMGAYEEAFENLRRSLYVDKSFVLGHFSMGNYFRWRRQEARAARSYRNVLRLLEDRGDEEEISGDGLTVGRLREIVNQIL
jgi:chemotaxis protein methyltransferase CheR